MAPIAVEKVSCAGGYTFRQEVMEVDVLGYYRRPCGSNGAARKRYFYEAVIRRPDRMIAAYDFVLVGEKKDRLLVNVTRSINEKWKPPVFPDGGRFVEVAP